MRFPGLEDDVSSSDAYSPSNSQPQYYPATPTFPPPPTGGAYGQPAGNPYNVDPGYGVPREQPAYNPAEHGPINGPTLPPQDPYPYPRDQYDGRYDEANRRPGPENVSAPSRSEGRSDPGTSAARHPSVTGDGRQG